MRLGDSSVWLDDLSCAACSCPHELAHGGSFLVSGASGLVGSALVDLLLHLRARRGYAIAVTAVGRSRERLERRFGSRPGLDFFIAEADRPLAPAGRVDYLVHAASTASPDLYMSDPCGTIRANIDGIRSMLAYARAHRPRKVLYVSSSEIYGTRPRPGPAREGDYGRVDPLDPRACYAEAKRAAEAICAAYASQYGVPVAIVRPGHVYGPTATSGDRRVSSDFAFRAARGVPLVIKSAGTQVRSYCHCLDCATAMLTVLVRGASAQAYNVSNPDSVISIRKMAGLLAAAGGVPLLTAAPSAAERAAFNPMDDSSLDAAKLMSLGWRAVFPAETGLTRTVAALKEVASHGQVNLEESP